MFNDNEHTKYKITKILQSPRTKLIHICQKVMKLLTTILPTQMANTIGKEAIGV